MQSSPSGRYQSMLNSIPKQSDQGNMPGQPETQNYYAQKLLMQRRVSAKAMNPFNTDHFSIYDFQVNFAMPNLKMALSRNQSSCQPTSAEAR